MADAARYVGCDRKTFRREREVNEEFDDQIRRAEMSAEFKPLHAIRNAASKHWRAAAWLIERQDKQKAARRKARAKAAGEVSMSLEQFAKLTVQVKKVALSGVAFPEWEADLAQQLDEVFVKFAPTLAAKPEPVEVDPISPEPTPAEPVQDEVMTVDLVETSEASDAAASHDWTIPDWAEPVNQAAIDAAVKHPELYGLPPEPEYDMQTVMRVLIEEVKQVGKQHSRPTEKTCGEQREEVEATEPQEESVNAEVIALAAGQVA
ncbi:Uncharacterized protein SCF082_LOCUS22134 [Durusdinium trenchii]|uniref:Uncharacterized protein n=1 Tax=Durusdinium trenchii TaxID=1381693 RepID=A0ABP0LH31_9DINO